MESSRNNHWHIVGALSLLAIINLNVNSPEIYFEVRYEIGFSFGLSQLSQHYLFNFIFCPHQKACGWNAIFLLAPEFQREFRLQSSEDTPKFPAHPLPQYSPPCQAQGLCHNRFPRGAEPDCCLLSQPRYSTS